MPIELDAQKHELHERSLMTGELEEVGSLAPDDDSENWKGGISLTERLENGEVTEELLVKAYKKLAESFVKVSEGACIRCIDGRCQHGYNDNDPNDLFALLGPQVPGGSAVQALIYRLALGGRDGSYEETDLGEDIQLISGINNALGFQAGDHTDDQHPEGKTGCKAIDSIEEHAEAIGPETLVQVEAGVRALLGDKYNSDHFDHVIASVTRLLSVKKDYFISKEAVLEKIVENSPEGAPVLTGKHKEVFVVVNTVPNETLHRDHFSSQFDGEIQAFGYDLWHTFDIAAELFPDNEEAQSKFAHARLAMAMTALMDLTDGSLRLVIRTPKTAARPRLEDVALAA